MSYAVVRKFFAIDRFRALFAAFADAEYEAPAARLPTFAVLIALGIACLPPAGVILAGLYPDPTLPTTLTGVATILAITYRVSLGIPLVSVKNWSKELSLTHTAFALGCVPLVMLMIFAPETLLQTTKAQALASSSAGTAQSSSISSTLIFILGVAGWAALTEECIYRGLIVGALRRWSLISSPKSRDLAAVILSGVIFGAVHYPTWGAAMSIVLGFVGVGFGVAYIAIRERILPLLIYHLAFDLLSIGFTIFQSR